jgi:hypothetical protein
MSFGCLPPRLGFCIPHSAFRIPHSAFRIPHSAFRIPHSAFRISKVPDPRSSCNPWSKFRLPCSGRFPSPIHEFLSFGWPVSVVGSRDRICFSFPYQRDPTTVRMRFLTHGRQFGEKKVKLGLTADFPFRIPQSIEQKEITSHGLNTDQTQMGRNVDSWNSPYRI